MKSVIALFLCVVFATAAFAGASKSWEANHPLRVVNLLQHTTGWDDMHCVYLDAQIR